MKLTFWGAARQVTGSMYLLELPEHDYRILIDCGTDMERDWHAEEASSALFPFEASSVNLVLLTHAHIDHSGNIPNLYREGFEGQILCTPPTYELTELLLYDAAHLNQQKLKKAQGDSKKRRKKLDRLAKKGDLYFEKQVKESVDNFVTIAFNQRFKIINGVHVTFIPAGHLLGAAHILLEIVEEGQKKTICFSGDIGRKNYPLHIDPATVPQVDYLLCETTYGGRQHEDKLSPEEALADVIQRTCIDKPGRMIVPSFSVGRTQALLYTLNRLYTERGFIPIKVFSDSPLAHRSTKVYQRNLKFLNKEAREFQEENDSLFDFDNLQIIESEKASRMISNYNEPCIIISASGMVQGGRVEQHVAANISNPYCTILMVGYAAEGSLGHRLLEGQNTIRIKGKDMPVNASIERIDVFSGHADCQDLLRFVRMQSPQQLKKVFLIHGELQSMVTFQQTLKSEGYDEVVIPDRGQTFEL
ncbi:MAG: MBL fold metallo-hydrolase [Spirosomataceae bacterium]